MRTLYKEGSKRMNKELNLVKLVRNLRHLKILIKSTIMSEQIKFNSIILKRTSLTSTTQLKIQYKKMIVLA